MSKNADAHMERIKQYIEQMGDAFLEESSKPNLSFELYRQFRKNGDRQGYEDVYFERRKRLTTFGLLAYLYPNERKYVSALEEEIWQVCNEFTWCLPAHINPSLEEQSFEEYKKGSYLPYTVDLFASETAFTLAEMTYLFADLMDPFLIDKVKIEVDRRVLTNFLKNGPFHWETATHNWSAVCAGSIGMACLYIEEDKDRQEEILTRVFHALKYYLQGFEADGACTEGYGYWQYGFGYFVYFSDLLAVTSNEQVNLLNQDKVKQIALFQQRIFLADDVVIHYSDAPSNRVKPMLGFTHRLQKYFSEVQVPRVSIAQEEIIDHCGRWAPAFRELIWYDTTLKEQGWSATTNYFADSSIFISRRRWKDKPFSFSAKGGHNDEPHNHNDVGHFILFGGNQLFLRDLGAGQYNRNYFSDKRYEFICNSARGHSIPIINHAVQPPGKEYAATEVLMEESEKAETFSLNLDQAYNDPTLKQFKRTFYWSKDGEPELIMKDTFQFTNKPIQIVEQFVMETMPYKIEEDFIAFFGEGATLRIVFDKETVTPVIEEIMYKNHQGEDEPFLLLKFELQQQDFIHIAFCFQFIE